MNNSAVSDTSRDTGKRSRAPVGPVVQFMLLIVPVVMSAFFVVYAMTGWILEGRDRFNWAIEAESVASWVGAGIVGYSVLVASLVRWRGGDRRHPLVLSSVAHAVLAVFLVASIFSVTRL